MKTYLVPVDFSETSLNAARFAAALSHQTEVKQIILLNAYYVSPYETMLPNPDMVQLQQEEIEANAADRLHKLELIKHKLSKLAKQSVEIVTHVNRTHLVRGVVENVESRNVDVVMLGAQGNSSKEDTQIGGHVIQLAKACPVPVIVVPRDYHFASVKRVVVACDFNKVKDTVPLEGLKRLLSKKDYELMVVNVDHEARHKNHDSERAAEESALHGMLRQYHPHYYYLDSPDVISGILKFAEEKDAQIVIALPHKYSFFQSLLHNSISQQLAQVAAVPVLLLK